MWRGQLVYVNLVKPVEADKELKTDATLEHLTQKYFRNKPIFKTITA